MSSEEETISGKSSTVEVVAGQAQPGLKMKTFVAA